MRPDTPASRPSALRSLLSTAVALALVTTPALAQEHEEEMEHEHGEGMDHEMMMEHHPPVMDDLVRDVEEVRDKLMGLAGAIPEEDWDWRPMEGVRSVQDVFLHVAADNYFFPITVGFDAPPETGIEGDSYASVRAYETQEATPSEVMAMMEASFDHLLAGMRAADPMGMGEDVRLFGSEYTAQGVWLLTTTHLHEHLGQMIAYARSNGVVPPWSR